MDVSTFLQLLINSLLTGTMYGVIALGLSLVFGIMKVSNFAHGSSLMVSMYATWFLTSRFGWNPYASMLLIVPLMFFFGYILQGILIEPVFKKEHADVRQPIGTLLVTVGLGLVLSNLALIIFGADYYSIETGITYSSIVVGNIVIGWTRIVGFIGACLVTGFVYWFLNYTMLGKAMRATSQDREAARIMGIDDFKLYRYAFGLNMAIVSVAGALLLPYFFVFPDLGELYSLKAFTVAILGGVGNVAGAMLGGLLISFVESFATHFTSSMGAEIIAFTLFILMLLFRPKGLLGKE